MKLKLEKKIKYLALIPSLAIKNNQRKAQRQTWIHEAEYMLKAFFIAPGRIDEKEDIYDTIIESIGLKEGKKFPRDLILSIAYMRGVQGEWVLLCDNLIYLWMKRLDQRIKDIDADFIFYESEKGNFYLIRWEALEALPPDTADVVSALKESEVKSFKLTDITHPLQYPKGKNSYLAVIGERPDKILRIHERRNKPHVAIITIALGKYDRFFGGWYEAIQYYFLNACTRHYYVFTDNPDLPYVDCEYCTIIQQENLGWPGNTRDRFDMFLQLRKEIEENYDYVFFLQATARLTTHLQPEEVLPSVEEAGLWVTRNVDLPEGLTYDPNPRSAAYIPKGMGKIYAQGGAFGGLCRPFFQMCEECVLTLKHNRDNHVGEYLNDESHMNKYLLTRSPKEGWLRFWWPPDQDQVEMYNCKIYTLDKRRFGGFRALKEPKEKK